MEEEDLKKDRAWIEVNLSNLEYNIHQIKKMINEDTKIIAVVKADAYGHGAVAVAKKLNEIGIQNFAVASLKEGIELRKNGIKGDILILGYTNEMSISLVVKYDLIQTLVDSTYAEILNKMNLDSKIRCHLAINTGMNRIGENYKNIDKIIQTYKLNNLQIEGIFSHLCVSDSEEDDDIHFTNCQIQNFKDVIQQIKQNGINPGIAHIQASYGILDYSNIGFEYVRVGIIMYGVYATKDDEIKLNVKPVLSLKARVSTVREIEAGESVSYGRTFKSSKKMQIASVTIGYADGYPRNLSNKNVKVMIHGKTAEVIGRICMDQLIIDISNIPDVKTGDIVTLIGDNSEISAEQVSDKAGIITYELLSRLGKRVEKVLI